MKSTVFFTTISRENYSTFSFSEPENSNEALGLYVSVKSKCVLKHKKGARRLRQKSGQLRTFEDVQESDFKEGR